MGTLQDALNLIGEVHDALAFNNVGGGRGKLRDAARILRELIDKDAALEAETGGGEAAYEPCGGCGNADPDKRCLGCLHPFVATTTDERAVEALPNWNGWRSIDTAPEDCRVILATSGNWVGEAIMLRDEDTGEQIWTWVDTGKPSRHSCYGWQHLPEALSAPVASDLRPDGFDGPTGAE